MKPITFNFPGAIQNYTVSLTGFYDLSTYRADIAAAGIGDGRHGFDLDLDEPMAPGTTHTVEVRRSADGLRIFAMAMDAAGAWTPLLAA